VSNADVRTPTQSVPRRPAAAPHRAASSEPTGRCRSSSSTSAPTGLPARAHHRDLRPRYEALLHEIFHGAVLPDDFSLYLHAPTVTDPSLAPSRLRVLLRAEPVPNLAQAAIDWPQVAPAMRTACSRCSRSIFRSPPPRRDAAVLHAARLPSASSARGTARRSRWRRISHSRRVSDRTTATRTSRGSTSSAPARIRAPACRASSTRPKATVTTLLEDLAQ
jgi:phytoene dehydrogenase-like protein